MEQAGIFDEIERLERLSELGDPLNKLNEIDWDIVDGKVSSLNSFLTPSNVDKATGTSSGGYTTITTEMADVDGSYGENDSGIFFFTSDGRYIEWTGTYLYSDIPFSVENPVVRYEVGE